MSDVARGITGMERTSAPLGPNMFDGGPASKVTENTQPFNNCTNAAAKHSTEHNVWNAAGKCKCRAASP